MSGPRAGVPQPGLMCESAISHEEVGNLMSGKITVITFLLAAELFLSLFYLSALISVNPLSSAVYILFFLTADEGR